MRDTALIEALLGRVTMPASDADRVGFLAGARVLVTGAGGSIGGEIARVAAGCGVSHLTLLDHHAGALFEIDREIAATAPSVSRSEVLCDVRDRNRVREVVLRERPDFIFHAAAIKHVNIVERHVAEGALTNLIGARNVAEAAQAVGAAMTLISTDKAAVPTSRMGQTKRLAERLVSAFDLVGGPARFVSVRFGNVFGSSGSVYRIFRSQIEQGGPVTLTDPRMERYFMTAAEAVRLTFEATAVRLARAGRETGVLVLEMGAPVRIADLADRMIARLAPDPAKIEIRVVGPRPGESAHERLIGDDEARLGETPAQHVIELVAKRPCRALSTSDLDEIEALARLGDDHAVAAVMDRLMAVAQSLHRAT